MQCRLAQRAVSAVKPLLRLQARRKSEDKSDPPPPKPEFSGRYNYCPELEIMINMQIQVEHQAAHDYLGMAVHFAHPDVARPGCYGFFMRMYEEEREHALLLVRYQLTRGGLVQLGALCPPASCDKLCVLPAFRRALCMEHQVTEKLEKLVMAAESNKDYQCADYVTSVLLQEQMRSVSEMAAHVTRLARLDTAHALHHYDQQLLAQYPYSDKQHKQ